MTDDAESVDPRPINALVKAVKILEQFAVSEKRTLGVSELARTLDMSRSGVYRILNSLKAVGFVEQERSTSQYALGIGALRVGMAYQRSSNLVRAAADSLRELSEATGESVTLSVRRQWTRVYLDQVPSHHELRVIVSLGVPYPLHAGASSKVILANLTPDEVDEYLTHDNLYPITDHTIVDEKGLLREIGLIRAQGYATSEEERQVGAISAAAPLFSTGSGRVVGALSITGPVERLAHHDETFDRAIQLLVAQAKLVSERLP